MIHGFERKFSVQISPYEVFCHIGQMVLIMMFSSRPTSWASTRELKKSPMTMPNDYANKRNLVPPSSS